MDARENVQTCNVALAEGDEGEDVLGPWSTKCNSTSHRSMCAGYPPEVRPVKINDFQFV